MCTEALKPEQYTSLWTVEDCAGFLRKSKRWVWNALSIPPELPGSIPHYRIGRSPRFEPLQLQEWVRCGCPPSAEFGAWQKFDRKHRKSR